MSGFKFGKIEVAYKDFYKTWQVILLTVDVNKPFYSI